MTFDDYDTDREVAGICYRLTLTFAPTPEGKAQAQREAYFERWNHNRFSRAMRVLEGPNKGHWGCFVSYCRRGE